MAYKFGYFYLVYMQLSNNKSHIKEQKDVGQKRGLSLSAVIFSPLDNWINKSVSFAHQYNDK